MRDHTSFSTTYLSSRAVLILTACIVTSCSSQKEILFGTSCEASSSTPSWFCTVPVHKSWTYGRGYAVSQDPIIARQKSMLLAQSDLASQLSTTVNLTRKQSYAEVTQENDNLSATDFVQEVVTESTIWDRKTDIVNLEVSQAESGLFKAFVLIKTRRVSDKKRDAGSIILLSPKMTK